MARLRDLIPSMFHRRLLLIGAAMVGVMLVLSVQMFRLSVVEGAAHLQDAESKLSTRKLVPSRRGRILDRKGRVLAEDEPCWDLAVDYAVISGEWAFEQGVRAAKKAQRDVWAELSPEQRDVLIDAESEPYERQAEALWQAIVDHCDIDRAELERRKKTVIERVQIVRASVWERRAARQEALTGERAELDDVVVAIREERQAHTLIDAVTDDVMAYFRKHEDLENGRAVTDGAFPGLHVLRNRTRVYPLVDAVVDTDLSVFPPPLRKDAKQRVEVKNIYGSLVGKMREVEAEDVDQAAGGKPYRLPDGTIDLKGYLPGDAVGKFGVERAAERRLRGTRGQETRRRDINATQAVAPLPGQDVQLTVDVYLQARMQALMNPEMGLMRVQPWHNNTGAPTLPDGRSMPLDGAAVVLEVDSGQLLAMAYSPSSGADVEEGQTPPAWPSGSDMPGLNRALAAVYPPGSTLKPIVYCIAAAEGVIAPDTPFECAGHLLENRPNKYRCWGWRPPRSYTTHGKIGPIRAIAESCNIYFYSCGRELGPMRLVAGLEQWGYGHVPGLGLDPAEELHGLLPDLGGSNVAGRGLTMENAILMGIGQGPVSVTPLQVANAHAALARGGYWTNPVLMMHKQAEQEGRELNLPPKVVANAWQGMYESANTQGGTGYHINFGGTVENTLTLSGVTVRAKTGTAQTAIPRWVDLNGNGERDEGETFGGSHSWYVCHVSRDGEERTAYVIVVIVEHGGSGGRVSGPIVNQILHAMRAEGYL